MQLFYNPDIHIDLKTLQFNKEESRHIVKVLRKTAGDTLHITDGKGTLFKVEILQAHDKKCLVSVKASEKKDKAWNYHLHIAIAPTKMNDRFEWFLEKATEIGIDEITPLICDHSERRQVKIERLEKVIVSAMKQSLKFQKPVLNKALSYTEFIAKKEWDLGLIAHCEDGDKKNLKTYFPNQKRILILIGPEGDFSPMEIEAALKSDINPVTLGENRLRTETAGVVACTTVSLLNE
ncbi:16S rRNA (uracil(1498)-N(3))-methyltransferase [Lutimonas sp.]|uniref:16S rRNA (uracil(1498)-N(3))-methyltransferase n=1 Tax=Lutimonas sp. TaxID=1872403 RepID=UPI003D9B451E